MSLAAPGAAKESVDPNTLNPTPPESFNATCSRTGNHISCGLAFGDPDIIDEPSAIVCDGTELLVTQHRSVVGKRLYDAEGNLLQRHFREYFDGTFTNPDTGLVALWTQHDTVVHNLGVPEMSRRAPRWSAAWAPGPGSPVEGRSSPTPGRR